MNFNHGYREHYKDFLGYQISAELWVRKMQLQCWGVFVTFLVKPLSHQTALPQRLYSVLKPCQRAVGTPRNTPKNIKFVIYSVYTTSSQRPHDVPTASLQRPWRFHSAQAVAAACSQRAHGAHTAFSRRTHSVLTAIIAFKIFYLFFFILSNPILQT